MELKFKNDKHYEECIVQALIVDHQWAEQMVEVLDLNYFNLEHLKETAKIMFNYYEKYRTFPSFPLIVTILKKDFDNELIRSQIFEYLKKIKSNPLNGDLEYVKESSLDFCKRRSLALALEKTLDLIEKKKYEQILPGLQKAILAGSDKDVGHIFLDHFEKRVQDIKRNSVPVPWLEINRIMHGGLAEGELGVIMAGTGVGKSHALVDIGCYAACQGYNVAHYTFELGDIYVGKRYDSRISLIPFDNLLDNKERVENSIKEIKGKIIIKAYPAKSITALGIKNHVSQLILRDMKPDILLVDSGDLMKSSRSYDQKRLEEETVYEELRSLSQELKIPIWTVTQSNREGLDLDVITLKNVSECIGKAFIADFFLTMTRKKENNFTTVGNFFVAKSRLGPDGIKYPILVTTGLSKIEVLDPNSIEVVDEKELDGNEVLKNRLRKFMQEGSLSGN